MKQLISILLPVILLTLPGILKAQTPPNAEPPHQHYRLGPQREQVLLLSEDPDKPFALQSSFKRDRRWSSSQVFLKLSGMPGPYHFKINNFLFSTVGDASRPLEFNITPILREKNNRVELQFDSTLILQQSMHCAAANLVIREALHVRDIRVSTYPSNTSGETMIRSQLFLQSFVQGDKKQRILNMVIRDSSGMEVFSDRRKLDFPLAYRQETEFSFDHSMEQAVRWSPAHPYLYHVEIHLLENGLFYGEQLETNFGMVAASFQDSILLINGDTLLPVLAAEEVLDQLLCMNEEQRMDLLEKHSFNAIQSRGILPEELLAFCDRKGIIILQHTPVPDKHFKALSNHPCLVLTEE